MALLDILKKKKDSSQDKPDKKKLIKEPKEKASLKAPQGIKEEEVEQSKKPRPEAAKKKAPTAKKKSQAKNNQPPEDDKMGYSSPIGAGNTFKQAPMPESEDQQRLYSPWDMVKPVLPSSQAEKPVAPDNPGEKEGQGYAAQNDYNDYG